MERVKFTFEDTKEETEFFVLEQTKVNGSSYILVTDSEEDGAVTVRDRDTMEQERIKIEDLKAYFAEKFAF